MIEPTKFKTMPATRLWTLDKIMQELRRSYFSEKLRKEFAAEYPEYVEMLEWTYEGITAYHSIIMDTLKSRSCYIIQAWTEPRFTGRGHPPATDFNEERYAAVVAQLKGGLS